MTFQGSDEGVPEPCAHQRAGLGKDSWDGVPCALTESAPDNRTAFIGVTSITSGTERASGAY